MSTKLKKLNIKEAIKRNELLDKKEKEEKEVIPLYKRIYPPIKDLFIYDENNEISNNLLKIKTKIGKPSKRVNFLIQEKEVEEMDEEFLSDIIKNPCPIPQPKVIEIISQFIQKTKLIEKLESDFQSEKKIASNSLSNMCAQKLSYCEYFPGDIIFKIGESGENFYFILSGNVSILKPKEIPCVEMTFSQYINYCMFLIDSKEDYLLNETLKANDSNLNLSSIEDIKSINKIIFMKTLTENINKTILNNNHLKIFFEQNRQKFNYYDIKDDELELIEQQKLKGKQGAGKEWENYITKRCKLTITEQVFFQPFEKILLNDKPRKIRCFCYHSFLYLGPGLFFGDNALDFENNKRNATIRAEEYSVLAYLKRDDYLNIISPKHKMEKMKEIEFIYNKYFFEGINSHIFEKNFFHLFSPREYYRGSILFSPNTIPTSLILLKSGRISLELKASVIDIQNLIKYIYNNIFTNPLFSKLSQKSKNRYLPINKIAIIKNYINDPILSRLKTHNSQFIDEMNIIKNYQIKILTKNESIGLEEIFLRLPYIMKSIVISEKIFCYELAIEHIDKMLNIGYDVIHSYIKFSMNKIITLIERLQDIKENCINMALSKYEKETFQHKMLKNIDKDKNQINNKKNKEEKIVEKSRNKSFINKELNSSYKDKEINFTSNENNNNYSTIISQNSSPIKLFMTNISPKSKSMFEKIKLNYKKLQNRQFKPKNNINNNESTSMFNNTISLKKTSNTTVNRNNNNNNTINKPFFNTTELYKNFSYDSSLKEGLKTTYQNKINNINNISNSMTPKYSIHKKIFLRKEEKIYPEKEKENYNNERGLTTNKSFINNYENVQKKHYLNFSFVPLDIMCQSDKNIPFVSSINKLLALNKRTNDFYNNFGGINNNSISHINNNENIYKTHRNQKINEMNKRLKLLNKKYEIKNVEKENDVEKALNIINKKELMTGIIKDFYKDIKLNGYCSLIHNKEINTFFMKRYNKKYVSAEKLFRNSKMNTIKQSDSLPLLI